jgi:hypothetical protein
MRSTSAHKQVLHDCAGTLVVAPEDYTLWPLIPFLHTAAAFQWAAWNLHVSTIRQFIGVVMHAQSSLIIQAIIQRETLVHPPLIDHLSLRFIALRNRERE